MHKLLALNQRQKMVRKCLLGFASFIYRKIFSFFSTLCQVLQRKTEEASMATKRLKELLESRKTSSRETSGHVIFLFYFHFHVIIVY